LRATVRMRNVSGTNRPCPLIVNRFIIILIVIGVCREHEPQINIGKVFASGCFNDFRHNFDGCRSCSGNCTATCPQPFWHSVISAAATFAFAEAATAAVAAAHLECSLNLNCIFEMLAIRQTAKGSRSPRFSRFSHSFHSLLHSNCQWQWGN